MLLVLTLNTIKCPQFTNI